MPPQKRQKNKKNKLPKKMKTQYTPLSKLQRQAKKYQVDLTDQRRDTLISVTSEQPQIEEEKIDARSLWKKASQRAFLTGCVVEVFKNINKQVALFGTSKRTSTFNPKSIEATLLMRKSSVREKQAQVLNPSSKFMRAWNLIMGIILLYISLVVPYRAAFSDDPSWIWMIFDFMISASLTTDIVFIIYSKQHNLETQDIASSQSAKSYLKKWFTVDLLAALPVEITALVSGKWNLYLRPLRLIRVIRLTRIFKYTAMIRGYTRRRRIKCCKLEEGIKRILFITGLTLLLTHLVACMWYLFARLYQFNENTWVYKRNITASSPVYQYLVAFYWSVQTVTTVGFGDVGTASIAEMILSVLWMFLGVGFYSFVMGNVSSMMAQIDAKKAKLRSRLGALDKYAESQHIPETLYIRIKLHIQQNFSRKEQTAEKEDLLDSLPPALKVQLMNHTHGNIISSLSFFENKSWNFVWTTVPLLKQVNFAKYEIIYREGDISNECYFLLKGQVAFSTPLGIPFRNLVQGMTFGDISLLAKESRNQTAITISYSELLTLSKSDFNRILNEFPKDANDIILECKKKEELLEEGRKAVQEKPNTKALFKELLELRSAWKRDESFNTSLLQFSPRKSFLSDRGESTPRNLTTTAPTQQKEEVKENIKKLRKDKDCLTSRLETAWETERIDRDEQESKSILDSLSQESTSLIQGLKAEGNAQKSIRQLIQKIEESASMLAGVMETVCREEGIIKRTVKHTTARIDTIKKEQKFWEK